MEVTAMVARMSEEDARACIDSIKTNLETVRERLSELHEREGWASLGYATWQDCISAEFNMSKQRAHQLLNAHTVGKMLAAPGPESTIVDSRETVAEIPESHARELEPLVAEPEVLREVYAEVQEQTGGQPKATDYRKAVDRRLGVTRPTAPVRYVHDADSRDLPDLDASQDTEAEPGAQCFECRAPVPVGADECPACVASPAAPDEPAPVTLPSTQAIRDAHLGSEFLHALRFASQIAAYAPERIVAVLRMDDADATERSLERLGAWLDRYRQARTAPLRVVGR